MSNEFKIVTYQPKLHNNLMMNNLAYTFGYGKWPSFLETQIDQNLKFQRFVFSGISEGGKSELLNKGFDLLMNIYVIGTTFNEKFLYFD